MEEEECLETPLFNSMEGQVQRRCLGSINGGHCKIGLFTLPCPSHQIIPFFNGNQMIKDSDALRVTQACQAALAPSVLVAGELEEECCTYE